MFSLPTLVKTGDDGRSARLRSKRTRQLFDAFALARACAADVEDVDRKGGGSMKTSPAEGRAPVTSTESARTVRKPRIEAAPHRQQDVAGTVPHRPNQRWSLDFGSGGPSCGRRFRALTVIDDLGRERLATVLDTSLSG